jgi:sortase (surface protein transpeptidase)
MKKLITGIFAVALLFSILGMGYTLYGRYREKQNVLAANEDMKNYLQQNSNQSEQTQEPETVVEIAAEEVQEVIDNTQEETTEETVEETEPYIPKFEWAQNLETGAPIGQILVTSATKHVYGDESNFNIVNVPVRVGGTQHDDVLEWSCAGLHPGYSNQDHLAIICHTYERTQGANYSGMFSWLKDSSIGDIVTLETAYGTYTFVVTDICEWMAQDEYNAGALDCESDLVLATCRWTNDDTVNGTKGRVLVYCDLIDPEM